MLVIEELKQLHDESEIKEKPRTINTEQILELFEKLEIMLENINPECTALLDDIRAIPEADTLAKQIESYDFEAAAKTFADLKKKMEG